MTTWCVGGRAAPPRGGGSLAICLLASSGSEKKRGTVLLTVAQTTTWCERRAVLSKTFHTLCYVTLCCKRIPTKTVLFFSDMQCTKTVSVAIENDVCFLLYLLPPGVAVTRGVKTRDPRSPIPGLI